MVGSEGFRFILRLNEKKLRVSGQLIDAAGIAHWRVHVEEVRLVMRINRVQRYVRRYNRIDLPRVILDFAGRVQTRYNDYSINQHPYTGQRNHSGHHSISERVRERSSSQPSRPA